MKLASAVHCDALDGNTEFFPKFLPLHNGSAIPTVHAVPSMPIEEDQVKKNGSVRTLFADAIETLH
jgi:hypothetical protein